MLYKACGGRVDYMEYPDYSVDEHGLPKLLFLSGDRQSLSIPPREPMLDVALAATGNLQAAIDVGKHGGATSTSVGPDIMQIAYGKSENIYTYVIHRNTSADIVLAQWHSLLPVKLCELVSEIYNDPASSSYVPIIDKADHKLLPFLKKAGMSPRDSCRFLMLLDATKMALYGVTIDTLMSHLKLHLDVDKSVVYNRSDEPCYVVLLKSMSSKIMYESLRPSISFGKERHFDVRTIFGKTNIVCTTFKGNFLESLMRDIVFFPDADIFTTDSDLNVRVLGRLTTAKIYLTHLSGDRLYEFIGCILFADGSRNALDFDTMVELNAFKGLVIERQVDVLLRAVKKNLVERIDSDVVTKVLMGIE